MGEHKKATGPEHEAFNDDVLALLNKHAGKLDAVDMLAIAAKIVGKLWTLQDRRKYTPEAVSQIVYRNIALGNEEMIAARLGEPKGRAV